MSHTLPHSVLLVQPHSVADLVYRFRMTESLKKLVARRVMDLLRARKKDPGMSRAQCETELKHLGLSPGNAQRLLDDTSDVQLSRIAQVAAALKIKPADLLHSDFAASAQQVPLAVALEVLGQHLAREMDRETRVELGEALATWARWGGKDTYRDTVAQLLTGAIGKRSVAA